MRSPEENKYPESLINILSKILAQQIARHAKNQII